VPFVAGIEFEILRLSHCTGLEQARTAARTFKPMTADDVSGLLSRTAQPASRGEYELFKTTSIYDGTAVHPEWLGEEPPEVKRVIQTA
jgi:hypothetical protein